jgi:excisionase family DNA binding protein
MTVREAARALEVSESLVYKLCAAGRLGHRRVGLGKGVIRIDPEHIAAFNRACAVEAADSVGDQSPPRAGKSDIPDVIGRWEAEDRARRATRSARRP